MSFNYMEKFSVAGKKCIVTGGAQGLSRGMAEGLLENGAEVVLMDLQAEKLQKVVDEYNAMCESADTKFYKPRNFMKPIKKGPFYAGKFRPGGYGTLGGIKINCNAEVLDKAWEKIPGLYAAGTDTCAIYGDSYMFLLPGNTMGYCINTGRFAGENAAEYALND